MGKQDPRPVFLDLSKISLPVTAFVSILHRASGAILTLSIPFFVYYFASSLHSEDEFQKVAELLDSVLAKIVVALLILALVYHLVSGVRFLLLDASIGSSKDSAMRSSRWVMILAMVMTILLLVPLYG